MLFAEECLKGSLELILGWCGRSHLGYGEVGWVKACLRIMKPIVVGSGAE